MGVPYPPPEGSTGMDIVVDQVEAFGVVASMNNVGSLLSGLIDANGKIMQRRSASDLVALLDEEGIEYEYRELPGIEDGVAAVASIRAMGTAFITFVASVYECDAQSAFAILAANSDPNLHAVDDWIGALENLGLAVGVGVTLLTPVVGDELVALAALGVFASTSSVLGTALHYATTDDVSGGELALTLLLECGSSILPASSILHGVSSFADDAEGVGALRTLINQYVGTVKDAASLPPAVLLGNLLGNADFILDCKQIYGMTDQESDIFFDGIRASLGTVSPGGVSTTPIADPVPTPKRSEDIVRMYNWYYKHGVSEADLNYSRTLYNARDIEAFWAKFPKVQQVPPDISYIYNHW